MSLKPFVAGIVTVALPVALVIGVLHFTHEYPAFIRIEAPIPKATLLFKHCPRPAPLVPARRRHPLAAVDDTAD